MFRVNNALGLQQALDYVNGDTTKARSMFIEIPDEEAQTNQIIYRKIANLSGSKKQKAIQYLDELAASG